jgi:hypothetical protein
VEARPATACVPLPTGKLKLTMEIVSTKESGKGNFQAKNKKKIISLWAYRHGGNHRDECWRCGHSGKGDV